MQGRSLSDNVDRLSELIIDSLKELYSSRQTVSSKALSETLSKKKEVVSLLHSGQVSRFQPGIDLQHGDDSTGNGDAAELRKTLESGEREIYFREFQKVYLGLLKALQYDAADKYLVKLRVLSNEIRKCSDLNQLLELNKKILSLIKNYARHLGHEKAQVARLLKEVGKNLIEIEGSLLSSTEQAYCSNKDYNNDLEHQIEDIRVSVSTGSSLEVLKEVVLAKITRIRATIENKRKEDERQLEKAQDELRSLKQNLDKMTQEMVSIREQTESLALEVLLDPLTGIHNRRAYEQRVEEELNRYHRYQHVFSLILVDVDHFKQVNDHYSHSIGDRCLKEIAARLKNSMRRSDFFARYGGEEFVGILPETDRDGALLAAEKLRTIIEKTLFIYQEHRINLTVSIGVTQVASGDNNIETLFSRVDAAMYEAKRRGRNQVVVD